MNEETFKKLKSYGKGRAICTCGHLGDGKPSSHDNAPWNLAEGHGPCRVKGCSCKQFTWAKWTPEFKQYLDLVSSQEGEQAGLFQDTGILI